MPEEPPTSCPQSWKHIFTSKSLLAQRKKLNSDNLSCRPRDKIGEMRVGRGKNLQGVRDCVGEGIGSVRMVWVVGLGLNSKENLLANVTEKFRGMDFRHSWIQRLKYYHEKIVSLSLVLA